jgi:hypothetical protein
MHARLKLNLKKQKNKKLLSFKETENFLFKTEQNEINASSTFFAKNKGLIIRVLICYVRKDRFYGHH